MSRPNVARRLWNRMRRRLFCGPRCFLEPGHSGAHRYPAAAFFGGEHIWPLP